MRMHNDPFTPKKREQGCTCGKYLAIYIPAGEHIHPCKVHPHIAIYGSRVIC